MSKTTWPNRQDHCTTTIAVHHVCPIWYSLSPDTPNHVWPALQPMWGIGTRKTYIPHIGFLEGPRYFAGRFCKYGIQAMVRQPQLSQVTKELPRREVSHLHSSVHTHHSPPIVIP